MRFEGIHHITCITGDAPGNVDFYARVLGLRLVKKTVNQDDPTVYHLFYADEKGSPGADLTFFEYPGAAPGATGGRAGVLEEGQVRPGVTGLVRVEEVVDRRVVLVDRFLYQSQSEDADVEVDIPLSVARDRRDVVDAFELHGGLRRGREWLHVQL